MPRYMFRCDKCNEQFLLLCKVEDRNDMRCSMCDLPMERVFDSSFTESKVDKKVERDVEAFIELQRAELERDKDKARSERK